MGVMLPQHSTACPKIIEKKGWGRMCVCAFFLYGGMVLPLRAPKTESIKAAGIVINYGCICQWQGFAIVEGTMFYFDRFRHTEHYTAYSHAFW